MTTESDKTKIMQLLEAEDYDMAEMLCISAGLIWRELLREFFESKKEYRYFNEEDSIKAVKRNGYHLKYVKQQTEAICIEAVKETGYSLQYVKQQTEVICIEAVKETGDSLKYVKQQTEVICIEAVNDDVNALKYVNL